MQRCAHKPACLELASSKSPNLAHAIATKRFQSKKIGFALLEVENCITRLSLMQIGTADGRVKVIGAASTEATLTAPTRTATASLHILPNTGAFLRLDADGTLELWSVPRQHLTDALPALENDTPTACHLLPHDPYVLLGCASGALRAVAVLDADCEPLPPARPAGALRQMPFAALPDALGVPEDSPVLSVQTMDGGVGGLCALMLHEWQGVTVYSLHKRSVRTPQHCDQCKRPSARMRRAAVRLCSASLTDDIVISVLDFALQ